MPLDSKCWFDENGNAHVEIYTSSPDEMGLLACGEDVSRQMTLCLTILCRLEVNEKKRRVIQQAIQEECHARTLWERDGSAVDVIALDTTPEAISHKVFDCMVSSGMVRAKVTEDDVPF